MTYSHDILQALMFCALLLAIICAITTPVTRLRYWLKRRKKF